MTPTVLFVDDDKNLLQGLMRVLRSQPYNLLTANSAEEASYLLKTNKIEVVVSDECMPGMRGTEYLKWVAEHFPQTVRILLTGNPSPETAVSAVNEGQVFRFLTKPCRDWDLAMAIRDALDECSAADEQYAKSNS